MGRRILASATIVLTGILAFVLVSSSSVHATPISFSAYVATTSTLSVEIDSATAENVVMDLAPNPGSTAFQDSNDIDITVTSNNRTGYYLTMSTTSNNLTNTADDTLHISSLDATNTTGYTTSNFPVNSWGYAVKTGNNYGNYFGVGDYVILQNAGAPATNTSTIKFATKVDSTLPSGVYTTSILFTTIAKPSLYMQDVAYWKDSVRTGESIQAIDNRDMKSYWVTRIETDPSIPDERADCTGTGNDRVCTQLWMTQNLDLDLDSTKTYTHTDTDLGWSDGDAGVTWQPPYSTTSSLEDIHIYVIHDESSEVSFSYNEEKFYYYGGGNDYRTLTQSECETLLGYNSAECYHFHGGNHYTGSTASAVSALKGDGTPTVSEEDGEIIYFQLPNSVCPAGWKLPQGLSSASDYSDFDYLLYYNSVTAAHGNTYILEDLPPSYDYYQPYVDSVGYATHLYGDANTETDGHHNISAYPLWFVHAGILSFSSYDGSLTLYEPAKRAGYLTGNHFYLKNGIGQHSTGEAHDAYGIYHMHTCEDCVAPADVGQYVNLYSVRCIAR